MVGQASSAPAVRPGSPAGVWIVAGTLAVLVGFALWVLGSRLGAKMAQRKAIRHIAAHELAVAQQWLAWSARLAPDDFATDLLKAACYRQLRESAAWRASLDEAVRKKAPPARVRWEVALDRLQQSGASAESRADVANLSRAGVPQTEVVTSLLLGCFAQTDLARAETLLGQMPDGFADEAHRQYLWALYARKRDDPSGAEARLTNALRAQPTHEPARAKLAELLEERHELDGALREYAELAARSRGSDAATLGLARVLRKQGRLDLCRAVLAPLASRPGPTLLVRVEMAQLALESGDYGQAEQWFRGVPLDEIADWGTLTPAAHTLLLLNKPLDAHRLFTKGAEESRRNFWIFELRICVGAKPGDAAGAQELQRLTRTSDPLPLDLWGEEPEPVAANPADLREAAAAEPYRAHCEACHGVRGDGRGIAARYLFPRARDLRAGRCRLVSTLNGIPTLEDVQSVLAQGMPGASMPSFQDLSEADRSVLAREVLRLRRLGVREELARSLRQEGEEVEEAELREAVRRCTTPGEGLRVPAPWPALPGAAASGKIIYAAMGCNKCHGDDGTGSPDPPLFDDFGEPSRARDLVHEPFKGGRDPQAIYARIVAGMPGSAHPAVLGASQEELIALVDYVRSLAHQPERLLTNDQRRIQASGAAYLEALQPRPD